MAVTAPESVPDKRKGGRNSRSPNVVFHWKKRGRLITALVVSLFFHLSMITIFRIVIVLPRDQVSYYDVHIVSSPPAAAPDPGAAPARPEDTLSLGGASLYGALPEVELPVIEFAELERLRIRYDAAKPLPEMDSLFEDYQPTDSWARFGGELQRFGKTLRELAFPGEEAPAVVAPPGKKRLLTHRPAEGFEAYIEWNGPPENRELLFSPPVKALWGVNPNDLERPLEIVFKVDSSGKVVNVWSPILEDSGMIDDVQMTVLQYRFAPLVGAAEQSGVLIIGATGDAP